jgi:hypothetical protein
MPLFNKIKSEGARLFSKIGSEIPNVFNKINEFARKADNSVAKVGSFLVSGANSLGLTPVADTIKEGAKFIHGKRLELKNGVNSLARAYKAPLSEARNIYN